MRYGLSYKGSKNALVEKLIPLFPKRTNFSLERLNKSYDEIEIKPDSLI